MILIYIFYIINFCKLLCIYVINKYQKNYSFGFGFVQLGLEHFSIGPYEPFFWPSFFQLEISWLYLKNIHI